MMNVIDSVPPQSAVEAAVAEVIASLPKSRI
jgi:hypothetical protein